MKSDNQEFTVDLDTFRADYKAVRDAVVDLITQDELDTLRISSQKYLLREAQNMDITRHNEKLRREEVRRQKLIDSGDRYMTWDRYGFDSSDIRYGLEVVTGPIEEAPWPLLNPRPYIYTEGPDVEYVDICVELENTMRNVKDLPDGTVTLSEKAAKYYGKARSGAVLKRAQSLIEELRDLATRPIPPLEPLYVPKLKFPVLSALEPMPKTTTGDGVFWYIGIAIAVAVGWCIFH